MKKVKINERLVNSITPFGMEFDLNTTRIGSNIGKISFISKYPSQLSIGWAKKLCAKSSLNTLIFIPVSHEQTVNAISQNIAYEEGKALSESDPYKRQVAQKKYEDGQDILERISSDNEICGKMIKLAMPLSDSYKTLSKMNRIVENNATSIFCKARSLTAMQKEGYKALSPYNTIPENIEDMTSRITTLSTFLGGFLFSENTFNDGKGYYFAKDSNGGLAIVDTWKREKDRANSNFAIVGVSGSGKSTAIKHILLNEYMIGTKLLIIDHEGEYETLTKKLEGDYIDCAGGKGGKLNPLQIRPIPVDDEDTDQDDTTGSLASHLSNLETFFTLYLNNISQKEMNLLKQTLEELYKNFGIVWNTDVSQLRNEDFPIMKDLYELLVTKSNNKDDDYYKEIKDLSLLLRDIAIGSDSSIFNGHSTIDPKGRIVCLNTSRLQSSSTKIKRTQYYNMLSWCWEQMTKDRNEKIMLLCDEAHVMIDPDVPQSLIYMRNIAKRCRKYEGALVVASQQIVDFLDERIKLYGQALLNQATYKIFLGTDGQDLDELKNTFKLNEGQVDTLLQMKRGQCIMKLGATTTKFQIEIPDNEWEFIGDLGGR